MISAQICIESYFNQHEFDNYYKNPKTNEIKNIFTKPLKKARELPSSLLDFIRLRTIDLVQTKKLLIEDFIPQITIINSPSYIYDAVVNESPPKIGFLGKNFSGKNIQELLINSINGN